MLFLDGVYTTTPWGKSRFHRTYAPDHQELTELLHTVSYRVAGFLEREGILNGMKTTAWMQEVERSWS